MIATKIDKNINYLIIIKNFKINWITLILQIFIKSNVL